ncbi:tRNA pseudouridine(38-40) synthase TruA [Psychrilyobacter sp.]|uniref:tRNA pseudouridine(38-40) synthase TruA n=1 Tax=Psychrilyobacter sp. TaxID=2586924 RepID=UPI0030186C9E
MRNIKLIYQYDGSDFFGFQRQPDRRTVQGELEKGLYKIIREKINLISSGRTDRGVHAVKQISNFTTDSKIPTDRLVSALDNITPKDIKILKVEEVDMEFHSRFLAKTRAYEFILTPKRSIFETRYLTEVKENIDVDKLYDIMKVFLGKHNFDGFRMTDCGGNNPIREIFDIRCYEKDNHKIGIYIKGNAFLKTQIRIMVGSSLAVYFNEKPCDYLLKKLENPDSKSEKIVIDGAGLYLCEINY